MSQLVALFGFAVLFASSALAQTTAPGTAPATTTGGIMDYWWVVLLVVIILAAFWFFRGRNRSM
jgi:LPXTG-motif cell wall-anchored protein